MTKTGKRVIYWDTTCWLAWLWDERNIWPADIITGLEDVVRELEANQVILLRSAVMRSEVLIDQVKPIRLAQYQRLLRRRNIPEINVDSRVMDRAAEIRAYHRQRKQSVSTPDAIHLATAIIYKAAEFHTMDGLQKGGSKRRKLLSLNGNVGGFPLAVVNPYPLNTPPAHLVIVKGPLFGNE